MPSNLMKINNFSLCGLNTAKRVMTGNGKNGKFHICLETPREKQHLLIIDENHSISELSFEICVFAKRSGPVSGSVFGGCIINSEFEVANKIEKYVVRARNE